MKEQLCLQLGMLTLWAAAGYASESLVYFGTYTGAKSQGIYVSGFDSATGKLSAPEVAAEVHNPSSLTIHPDGHHLYAAGETSSGGVVSAFSLNLQTGELTLLNRKSSGGAGPCYLALDATGKCILVANYNSGSVAALPVKIDGSLAEAASTIQHYGSSVDTNRQTRPYAHFICPSPDNNFALVCDLGLDKIMSYHLARRSLRPTRCS